MKYKAGAKKATLADLQGLIAKSPLSPSERKAFSEDLKLIRKAAELPGSAWDEARG